jgi:alpha-amylase/alpha-mannosidase (GH57 family)
MERYLCIHGHFYQPPRENPWLESVEFQESALPYHDWNERITQECYQPNATSRILGAEGRIADIANNYSRISFNFGPTLLSWLEEHAPATYRRIIESDRESMARYSGHGSAMAQAYNHMIMPLASERDRETQVLWGIRDFQSHFGRRPEGMWLPETAVDVPTLEVLARNGIAFTVLAPHQAAAVRQAGEETWHDVNGTRIDPSRAYRCPLPSGASIALFFYDGPVSRAVAFEHLLNSGEAFADRLVGAFSDQRDWPQLVHIATDGETFGHHHRYGDMALAYALRIIESRGLAKLTNYGEFLERFPPTHEAKIVERTSWSCPHGVERWRSDCGCNTGLHPKWNQSWRAPLRETLDWLRDEVAKPFEEKGAEIVLDPWAARNDYIAVVRKRTQEVQDAFCNEHGREGADRVSILKLMELQRHAMLMTTSCGWFFDELSGIETVQILSYAGRVIQLARELFGLELESAFLERIRLARSNTSDRDGRRIYIRKVKPAALDLVRVAAHYAVSSLFERHERSASIYCYDTAIESFESAQSGKVGLVAGRVRITSRVTRESGLMTFGAIHLTDQILNCGVRPFASEESYQAMLGEVRKAFHGGDYAEVIRLLDRHFGEAIYSLRELFRDEQRRIVHGILNATLVDIENAYRRIYESYAAMMRFHSHIGMVLPRSFKNAAEYVINLDLRRELMKDGPDPVRVAAILEESDALRAQLDTPLLEFALRGTLERAMETFQKAPGEAELMKRLLHLLEVEASLPFAVELWKVQNLYFELARGELPEQERLASLGDSDAKAWASDFRELGRRLNFEAAP